LAESQTGGAFAAYQPPVDGKRSGRGALRALVAAVLLALAGYAAATLSAGAGHAAGPVLDASVGPGFTISLKSGGVDVTNLAAGDYTVNVDDKGTIHNFHLTGPGVNRMTGIEEVATASWDVTFSAGSYSYVCDVHDYSMFGSFTVTGGSTTTTTGPTTGSTTTASPTTTQTSTQSTTQVGTTTSPDTTTARTTTTTSPGPTAVAALVQSVRVSTTGRRGRRVVLVRIDLRRAGVVRTRLLRRGRVVASARRALGTRPNMVRLAVPRNAPAGRYAVEILVGRQRIVRNVLLRG
jgi:plastocyanin